jgi:peptide/nickel transport system substrate-binding protein
VTLDLQPLLFEQQWAKAKGPAEDRQDLFELVWWPGFPDGYDSLYSLFHSEEEPLWNMTYWYDPEYDDIIDTAFSEEPVDPDNAQQLYNEAQKMVVDEALALYLFDQDSLYGVLPTLKLGDMALNPNYTSVLYFYHTSK